MNQKITKINHLLIGILIVFQPFIIMFQAMIVRDVQFLGFSIFEMFNILVASVSFFLTIYTHQNKKIFIKYLPYLFILGAYFILHCYNTYQFNNDVYTLQQANFLVEAYYMFRTFIVPLLLLFNIYYSGMEKEQIIKILEIFIFIIVSVMVITNLFYIAQRNYTEVTQYNKYNLFDWFNFENLYRRSYYELTTKGWFLSGNQMSAVMFMTFPVILYRTYKIRDVFHYILVTLQMLAMFMLGTKVANVGSLLIVLVFCMMWCIFKFLKHKERGIVLLLAISLAFVALFPFSPIGYKIRFNYKSPVSSSDSGMLDSALSFDIEEEELDQEQVVYYENLIKDSKILKGLNPNELSQEEKEFVKKYMADYCGYFGISTYIIDNYNDLDHSRFWANYIQNTPNNDYRVLKNMILENIYHENDNPLDKYFGMGYSLNYIYTEMDYSYQFYYYGMIGCILLIGPYFLILLYIILQGIRHFKQMFTLECGMYAVAPVLGLCVARLSGHVLERPLPLMIVAITLGILAIHTYMCVFEESSN